MGDSAATTTTDAVRDDEKERLVATASDGGAAAGRLLSLDVFRGLTVAGMILANNMGGQAYAPFRHAEWDGWTPTDLIFPSFLFIVGVSITFALSKRIERAADRRAVVGKILRRGAIIFGIGILLAAFPRFNNWEKIRIPGVLQRIALCYVAAALLFLVTRVRGQVIAAVALLVGYAALLKYVPVPGGVAGDWTRGHDLGAYLDTHLLRGHIYKSDYDPEGLLSTLPAIATTLLGVLAGHWLRSGRNRNATCNGLFAFGTLGVIAGSAWGAWFPINKALWTSSFVLLAAGWSAIGLGCCYWVADVLGYRRWAAPLRVLGTNPIVAYVLASAGARLLSLPAIAAEGGKAVSVHSYYVNTYLNPYLAPIDVSLAYAGTLLLACILVVWVMDALGVHVRA